MAIIKNGDHNNNHNGDNGDARANATTTTSTTTMTRRGSRRRNDTINGKSNGDIHGSTPCNPNSNRINRKHDITNNNRNGKHDNNRRRRTDLNNDNGDEEACSVVILTLMEIRMDNTMNHGETTNKRNNNENRIRGNMKCNSSNEDGNNGRAINNDHATMNSNQNN